MAPEHFTAQKMKKAYYLTQKIPDQVGDYPPPPSANKVSVVRHLGAQGKQFSLSPRQGFLTQLRGPLA